MFYAIGKTATFRYGNIVPGGKPFGIRESEIDEFKARGYEITGEKSPRSAQTVSSPEVPADAFGEAPVDEAPKVLSGGSDGPAPKMGGRKPKSKAQKEGE